MAEHESRPRLIHDSDKKPDEAVIKSYRTHLQDIWRDTHNKWASVYDPYYNRTYDVWDKRSDQAERPSWLRPARSTSIVDHAVDHQLSAEPQIHRFPVGEGDAHKNNADLTEKALTAILGEAALLDTVLTWKLIGKHLIHYGYAVHELDLDSRVLVRRADVPERELGEHDEAFESRNRVFQHYRRSAMPFRTKAPHPSDILMDPTEKRPALAIKHIKMFSGHLHQLTMSRKQYGKDVEIWDVGDNPWEPILVDIYWSDHWHAVMAAGNQDFFSRMLHFKQGELLFVETNTWGFVPYAHAFANFGMELTLPSDRGPNSLAVGILDPVIADLRAQAQVISARHNVMMDSSFNKVLVRGMGADEVRDQIDQGDLIEVPDEGALRRMEIPQYPRWMFQGEEWYSRDIEEGTVSRALSGIREQGVSTVGQQAILSTAAGRKFIGVAKQMEHLASVACSQILQLIDILDLDLTVRGHRIKPEYIEHDYSVQVSFDVIDPVIQLQQREIGMREVQLGIKSKETYRSADARIGDETGENKRLLSEWIRQNPLVHQALAMEVARAEGVDRLLQRAMTLAAGEQGEKPTPINGNGGGGSGLLGPDGQLLATSMGQTGGAPEAVRQLRQALTPDVASPGRNGANLAG